MAATIVPYKPLNTLKPIASDIWIVNGPVVRFGYLGLKVPFPTRMTLVRLPDGALWVHSPIEPDEDLIEQVRALGNIRFLIAPNTLHYWWIPDWSVLFPQAEIHAAPGLDGHMKRPIPPHTLLDHKAPPAWAETIDQVLVHGDLFTEVDFFHRLSRTLILTDLIENFEVSCVNSPFYRFLLRIGGAADPDGQAPLDMRLAFLRHRDAVRSVVQQMIAWAPERIILAHGRWYGRNAVAELQRAFRWVL